MTRGDLNSESFKEELIWLIKPAISEGDLLEWVRIDYPPGIIKVIDFDEVDREVINEQIDYEQITNEQLVNIQAICEQIVNEHVVEPKRQIGIFKSKGRESIILARTENNKIIGKIIAVHEKDLRECNVLFHDEYQ